MTNKTKDFDCIEFKKYLFANALKVSGAKTLKEYIDYVNKEAIKSSLHIEFAKR